MNSNTTAWRAHNACEVITLNIRWSQTTLGITLLIVTT